VYEDVLAGGRNPVAAEDRTAVDALCRQIDVRKKLDVAPEVAADLVDVLLANAIASNDGWGLKCANSALKALDLRPDMPGASDRRIRAIEVLDTAIPS
jgi:hypothetical protein